MSANSALPLVVSAAGMDSMIRRLRAQGRMVIGPTVRDGVITHDQIVGVSDLPQGWTEEQEGGSYRLQQTGTDELFAFSAPSQSWKQFVFPPRSVIIRGRREASGIQIEEPPVDTQSVAFFGVRSCDLAALDILDRVFLDPEATDQHFARRRADVFVVAAACASPGNTCFCVSMDTGPSPTSGFDLSVSELMIDGTCSYLVTPGSERGAALLELIDTRPATDRELGIAQAQHDTAVDSMGRSLDASHPPLASLDPDHPQWADVAQRCLACGNCTMVCPTCFCSKTEDRTSLDGLETERSRVWDSCFTLDFTAMHGTSTRTSTASRYRQWLLHKLVTWEEQFGSSGCVGCGRCIAWCPVGIDLTAEIAALAQTQSHTQTETRPQKEQKA